MDGIYIYIYTYISHERGDLLKMSWTLQRNLHPLVGTLRIRLMSLLVIHTRILSIRPRLSDEPRKSLREETLRRSLSVLR